jgi:hypothetical protein
VKVQWLTVATSGGRADMRRCASLPRAWGVRALDQTVTLKTIYRDFDGALCNQILLLVIFLIYAAIALLSIRRYGLRHSFAW